MTKSSKNKVDSVLDELLAREDQFSDENFSYAGMRLSSAGRHPDSLSIPSFMGVNFDELDDEFVEKDDEDAAALHEVESFSEEEFDPDIVIIKNTDADAEMVYDDSDEEFFELNTDDFEEAGSSKRSSRGLPTLFSFGGKRIKEKTSDDKLIKQEEVQEGESTQKKPIAIVSKAKEFWRNDVYPLFMEVDENSSIEDEASAEDFINAEDAAEIEVIEGGFSAKEMFNSVKERAVSTGKTVWRFMNDKVTHPLMEKLRLDSEEEYPEENGEHTETRESHLKLLERRKTNIPFEDDEFFDEEIVEEEKPSLFERVKRVFGEDEDDDYYYEDDEDEMSFFEAIKYLFKDERSSDEVDGEEKANEPKAKSKFSSIIEKAFFLSVAEEEAREAEVKTGEVVTSEFVLPGMRKLDESSETEEEDDFRVIPDQEIFDEVMREKAARIAAANAEEQAQN